jgi:hypothetical protein
MALEMPLAWAPAPEPELEQQARALGIDLVAELRKLRDRGERRVDWQARWRTWLTHAIAFARKQAKPSSTPASPDRAARADAERRAAIERDREENARRAAAAARDRDAVRAAAAATQAKLRGAG